MVSTPNYQFLQPDPNDFVNVVTQLNDNLTKVDQDMNRYDVQIFTADGTWTKPARCKRVRVRVQGGGGSGGGAAATGVGQISLSGAGGGGGYSEKTFLATALSSTETVNVGAGGAAATAGANPGNAGGTSRFATGKAYEVNATGGNGGSAGAAGSGSGNVAGGTGGVGSGGDINVQGSDGCNAIHNNTIAHATAHGGSSELGGSARADTVSSVGNAGKSYGGGSSGAVNYAGSLGAKQSAAGGQGVVIVENWY